MALIKELVSIIIPTYNRAFFLTEAIHSCINQTYRPVECIVVDDGSTDNTKELIKELIKNNEASFTLKYIYQKNAGSQIARNTGTAVANGAFIQYLDSDDLLYPLKIEQQVLYLKNNSSVDAVYGDWEKGTMERSEKITINHEGNLIEDIICRQPIAVFAVLMRGGLVKKTGTWDKNILRNQEIDFHLRALFAGGQFAYLSGNCGLWRIHPGERIANSTTLSAAIYFYHKWENILKEKGAWSNIIQDGIVNNYIWFLNTYPRAKSTEVKKLLLEVYRLQPLHPIFIGFKYRLCNALFGKSKTLDLWIKRFKSNTN